MSYAFDDFDDLEGDARLLFALDWYVTELERSLCDDDAALLQASDYLTKRVVDESFSVAARDYARNSVETYLRIIERVVAKDAQEKEKKEKARREFVFLLKICVLLMFGSLAVKFWIATGECPLGEDLPFFFLFCIIFLFPVRTLRAVLFLKKKVVSLFKKNDAPR